MNSSVNWNVKMEVTVTLFHWQQKSNNKELK